jgi:hypothetical protein
MNELGRKEYEAYIASLPPKRYKPWGKLSAANKAKFAPKRVAKKAASRKATKAKAKK